MRMNDHNYVLVSALALLLGCHGGKDSAGQPSDGNSDGKSDGESDAGTDGGIDDEIPPALRQISVASLSELDDAIDDAMPGDHITLQDGIYETSGPIMVPSKGTAEAPIVIRSQTIGGAEIQGDSGFRLAKASYVIVQGFKLTHAIDDGKGMALDGCDHVRITRNVFKLNDTTSNSHWLYVDGSGSGFNRFDHNRFENKPSANNFLVIYGRADDGGYAMSQQDRIDHNYFYKQVYPDEGGEALRIGDSNRGPLSAHAVVESNLFEECTGDPEVISNKSSENLFRGNTFRNNAGSLVLRHGNGSTVVGNFFVENAGGIRMYGDHHRIVNNYFEADTGTGAQSTIMLSGGCTEDDTGSGSDCNRPDGVIIAFNTLVGNHPTHLVIGSRTLPPKNCVIANNIIQGEIGTLVKFALTPQNLSSVGNILWGAGSDGDAPAAGFERIDPKLVKDADGLYRLAADSPAIDSAEIVMGLGDIMTDIDGQPRIAPFDKGADEHAPGGAIITARSCRRTLGRWRRSQTQRRSRCRRQLRSSARSPGLTLLFRGVARSEDHADTRLQIEQQEHHRLFVIGEP